MKLQVDHKNMKGRTYSLVGRDEIVEVNQTVLQTNPRFGHNGVYVKELLVYACQLNQKMINQLKENKKILNWRESINTMGVYP
jgi:hypothetical protein